MGSGEGRVQRGEWVRAAAGSRGVWDGLGGACGELWGVRGRRGEGSGQRVRGSGVSAPCSVFIPELRGSGAGLRSTALSSSVAVDKHCCWWEPSCRVRNSSFPQTAL